MVTLQLTDEQVVDIVRQLPPEQQKAVFELLLTQRWPEWVESSKQAQWFTSSAGMTRTVFRSFGGVGVQIDPPPELP